MKKQNKTKQKKRGEFNTTTGKKKKKLQGVLQVEMKGC